MYCVVVNVEGPVRRSARGGREDTATICPGSAAAQTDIGPLVVLIREDGDAPPRIRQGKTAMREGSSKRRGEVDTAVRADSSTGKGLPVKGDRERQRNRRAAIIAMVASVSGAGHDAVTSRRRGGIVTHWGCGSRCWGGCKSDSGSCCRRRRGRRRRARRGRRACCGRWARRASHRRLDCDHRRRSCFKVSHRRIDSLRRLICVKSEIVQCAEADSIRIGVLYNSLAVPSDRSTGLSHGPWSAAVTQVVKRAVICPARFLTRRMKGYVADVNARCQGHTEGLNAAVKILIVQCIVIVPDALAWISHFIAHEPDAIVCWVRLNLVHCSACPSHDGGLRPDS